MDENLSKTYAKALEKNGVSPDLAKQAADIIAKDDPSKTDLGRTEEEQAVVRQAWERTQPTTEE